MRTDTITILCKTVCLPDHQILVVGRPKICHTNPKWRTAAILKKMDKLLHFSNGSTDFYEILHIDAQLALRTVSRPNVQKINLKKFKMKNVKCNISAAVRPILMKFGRMMHLSPLNLMGNQKFQNPRWRTSAILKVEKSRYIIRRLADFDKILHYGTFY